MRKRKVNVAVIGVTGAVGQELLNVLVTRRFPINQLLPLASKRSAGKRIRFKGKSLTIRELTESSFDKIDVAIITLNTRRDFDEFRGIMRQYSQKRKYEP